MCKVRFIYCQPLKVATLILLTSKTSEENKLLSILINNGYLIKDNILPLIYIHLRKCFQVAFLLSKCNQVSMIWWGSSKSIRWISVHPLVLKSNLSPIRSRSKIVILQATILSDTIYMILLRMKLTIAIKLKSSKNINLSFPHLTLSSSRLGRHFNLMSNLD